MHLVLEWLTEDRLACGDEISFVTDFIAASISDRYSVGPSIRPICTRCCFTMTNMIQVLVIVIEPEYLS